MKDRIQTIKKVDDLDTKINKEATSLEKMKNRFKTYKNTYN